jgi:hypothetical protein
VNAEAVGIVNAERQPEARPSVDYRDVELAAARAAVVVRDEEIERLRQDLRALTAALEDICALHALSVTARNRGLDAVARRSRPVDLEQAAVNVAGSAAVLAAIETASSRS